MTVATFVQPDYTVNSDSTAYPLSIDAAISVQNRMAGIFAPHEQATPDMTVRLDAGSVFNGATLSEVAAQNTGTITAPSVNPRIDRVVIDRATGAVSVIAGSESATPTAPAITAGKLPVCQIYLTVGQTEIVNADLTTDERNLWQLGLGDAATKNTGTAAGTVAAGDHTHSLTSGNISDFTEASQDVVGAMVAAAGGSYDDGGGTISFPGGASVPYGNIQVFTASGTFTVPAGITKAFVEVWGAGGGAANTGDTGGGGGYAAKLITGMTPGTTVAVTVGTSATNTTGGTSSFGAYCSATGGQTGYVNPSTLHGGTGTGGDINLTGGGGHRIASGGGGAGGCSPRGGCGGGGPVSSYAADAVGAVPGGGGGHAADANYGAGGAGLVIVYW